MSETTEPGGSAAPELPVASAADAAPPADTTAAPAPAEPDAPESEAQDGDKPTRNGIQKRIGELVREREFWREQAMRAQQPPQQPAQPAQPAPLPPDIQQWLGAEPKPGDFDAGVYDPAYIEERAVYRLKAEQAKQAVAQRQVQTQQQQAQVFGRVQAAAEEAIAADPTLRDVLYDDSLPLTPALLREVAESDAPAKVLAFLGKNPGEAQRIAGLRNQAAMAREIGRLEARLTAAPSAQRTTNAPPPPPLARGRAAALPDPSKMSMEQYAKWRSGG